MSEAYTSAYNLYAKGDLKAARAVLVAHLKETPDDLKAAFLLGVLDLEEGAANDGLSRIEVTLKAYQPPAALCHRIGRLLFEQKRYQKAAAWLGRALKIDPNTAASHFWLGNALRKLGDTHEAEAAFKQAIRLAPGQARAHVGLAYLYREEGRRNDAADAMLNLAKLMPGNTRTIKKIGNFLAEINRLDLAEKMLSRILPEENENPDFLIRLGDIRAQLRLDEEAAQVYRRAIIRNPSAVDAYQGLAGVKTYESPDDPDAIILRQGLDNSGVSPLGIAASHFALGKVLDDCKDYAGAFEHFRLANEIRAGEAAFDRAVFRAHVQNIINTFKQDVLNAFPEEPVKGPRPVFVVGMVRSGERLIEDTLSRHPDVFGAGNLQLIGGLATGLGKRASHGGSYPDYIPAIDAAALQSAALYYLRKVSAESAGQGVLVDRNPLNFMHLGLIAGLFPDAKIIHCRRNPLDTVFSIYGHNFSRPDISYAYDLDDIAEVYLEYSRLMTYWAETLSLDIFDLDYEALVKFPEKVSQRLFASLGLLVEENREYADFDWQQPYRTSIDRWKHYEKHLEAVASKFKKSGLY